MPKSRNRVKTRAQKKRTRQVERARWTLARINFASAANSSIVGKLGEALFSRDENHGQEESSRPQVSIDQVG